MTAVDIAAFLMPDDDAIVRCAWHSTAGIWQITVTSRSSPGGERRRVLVYDVAPGLDEARLVGEIMHAVTATTITEERRLWIRREGSIAPAITIPRRMAPGQRVEVLDGAATITLASYGLARLGRLRRRSIVLRARERSGQTGEIELLEGIGESRVAGAEPRQVVYVEARALAAGRKPAWWDRVRVIDAPLFPGAPSSVL